MLKHLVTELASELSIPLQIEKESCYTLTINEESDLLFKDLNPGFSCKSRIAPLPQEGTLEDLYILCMRANFLGQGTKGAVIALDDALQHFLLILSVTEELNYRIFKETVEDFVNYLNYWKKRITPEQSS